MEGLSLELEPEVQSEATIANIKKKAIGKRLTAKKAAKTGPASEEGEYFDLDAVSASSDTDEPVAKNIKSATTVPRKQKRTDTCTPRWRELPSSDSLSPSLAHIMPQQPASPTERARLTMEEVIASATRRMAHVEEYENFNLSGVSASSESDDSQQMVIQSRVKIKDNLSKARARKLAPVRRREYIEISD
jgi:hypothetical protein